MRLVNCTPHEIVLFAEHTTIRLPAATRPARLIDTPTTPQPGPQLPIPVRHLMFGDTITDLPEARPGVRYIVSRAIAAACPDRDDLLVPGPVRHRPPHGVFGCSELCRFHHPKQ